MSRQPAGGRWFVPTTGRSPDEPHQAATTLPVFDLVFGVAVAQGAA